MSFSCAASAVVPGHPVCRNAQSPRRSLSATSRVVWHALGLVFGDGLLATCVSRHRRQHNHRIITGVDLDRPGHYSPVIVRGAGSVLESSVVRWTRSPHIPGRVGGIYTDRLPAVSRRLPLARGAARRSAGQAPADAASDRHARLGVLTPGRCNLRLTMPGDLIPASMRLSCRCGITPSYRTLGALPVPGRRCRPIVRPG